MIYFTLRSDEWILVLLRLSFFETISHLSEIFLPNMSFILSLCILFVLFRLFLCISLNTDLGCFFFFGGVSISSRFAWIPILLFKVKPFTTSCHSQIFYVHLNFLSNYCITSGQPCEGHYTIYPINSTTSY